MKKLIIYISICILSIAAYAIGPDVEELKVEDGIIFINYEGRQPATYPEETIRRIGIYMSSQLRSGKAKGQWADKYSAIHLYDEFEKDMLGADIITLEKNAKVNHINSLRLILGGFIEDYYAFSRSDSDLLAFFVTIYNAIYRGDMGYIQEKYQGSVTDIVDPLTVGLSLNYKDWAGASDILVPLTDKAERQDIRSLDTSALTDARITEALRKQPDKALEERKGIVDVKEREVVTSKKELDETKEDVALKEDQIAKTEAEITDREKEIEKEEKELAAQKEEAAKIKDKDEKLRKEAEIEEKEETIAATKEDQVDKQLELEEDKKDVEEEKKELALAEKAVEEKKAEIQRDKESIAKDERVEEIKEEIKKDPDKVAEELAAKEEELKSIPGREPIVGGKLYYLKVKQYLSGGHYANDLYIINALSGEYIAKAPEKPHIAGHKYEVIADRGVLVLTQGEGMEAHYLTLLDLDSLAPLVYGSDDIFHLSFIEKRGNYIYAIVFKESNDFRLGKFDAFTLKQVAESDVKIDKNTVFHMSGELIFANSLKKDMLVLKASDLTVENTIELP